MPHISSFFLVTGMQRFCKVASTFSLFSFLCFLAGSSLNIPYNGYLSFIGDKTMTA